MIFIGLAKAADVAAIAQGLLDGAEIPYKAGGDTLKGMDCQGLCKYCIRQAGGAISVSGSNTMWRESCAWRGTLKESAAAGKLVSGAFVFMLENDGKEPAKYRGDGQGNMSHMGVYVGGKTVWSVDASQSAQKVRSRDERNATHTWTHAAWFKQVDYGADGGDGVFVKKPKPVIEDLDEETARESSEAAGDNFAKESEISGGDREIPIEGVQNLPKRARVVTTDGRLNLRKAAREDSARIGGIEPGTVVEVLDGFDGWWQIRAVIGGSRYTGWAKSQYLRGM